MKKFLRSLTEKHKLSLRNIRTSREVWHIFTNRLRISLALIILVILLFIGITLLIAYTPILDSIPGYPGSKSRRLINDNIARLDSLEGKLRQWESYNRTLQLVVEGHIVPQAEDDTTKHGVDGHPYPRSEIDSLLRVRMETDRNYSLVEHRPKRTEATFEMFAPTRGTVVEPFDIVKSRFGIELLPQPNQGIMAVLDGTIILQTWEPDNGNMIVIKHAANMVTIYKKVTRVLYKTGQRVKAGEAIAQTGTVVEGKTPHLIFELWIDGSPVNPENYITF